MIVSDGTAMVSALEERPGCSVGRRSPIGTRGTGDSDLGQEILPSCPKILCSKYHPYHISFLFQIYIIYLGQEGQEIRVNWLTNQKRYQLETKMVKRESAPNCCPSCPNRERWL